MTATRLADDVYVIGARIVVAPGRWQRRAECVRRRLDPALFYPEMRQPADPRVFSACAACPVRRPCLRTALALEAATRRPDGRIFRSGIWGGLNERQRTNLEAGRPVVWNQPTGKRNGGKVARAAARAGAS